MAASAIAAVLVVAILFFAAGPPRPTKTQDPARKQRTETAKRPDQSSHASTAGHAPAKSATAAVAAADEASREETIPDDGQTMWASPTHGPPLSLRYLPIGTQIVIALRPADLAGHAESDKVLASLAPAAAEWRQQVERLSGLAFAAMDQLLIGLQANASGQIEATLIVRPQAAMTLAQTTARHARAVTATHAGATFVSSGQWAFYLPSDAAGRVVVIASPETIPEIIDATGDSPPLRQAMERLLATTDARRMLTLLGPPNYLLTDAAPLLTGPAARLHGPLNWLFNDRIEAISLSVHLDQNLFLELRASGPVDRSPTELAQRLNDRLEQMPDRVEDFLVGLTPRPYGRRILARLPLMLQILANYTRSGSDADQALLRCYLPATAAHNLLMGLDLALCETFPTTAASAAATAEPASLADRLARKTTLKFDRDTLQHAVELLSSDAGVPITILGGDLQLEGITQNQSFGIDVQDQPAEKILQRIVLLANPDKTVKKLNDPHQTLVYVIRPGKTGRTGAVVITTRKQAAARGEQLPEAFR